MSFEFIVICSIGIISAIVVAYLIFGRPEKGIYHISQEVLISQLQSDIVRLQAELAVLKDELTCEECEKSLEDTETGVTAFCMLCWNAMVTKLRAENKARDEEIKRLNAFKRFYHHIERHIRPDDELICNICGMSLNDIEQALNREKQGEKNGPEEAGVAASERDNNQ